MNHDWEEEWVEFKGLNFFGKRLAKAQKKSIKSVLEKISLPKSSKIIDVGCGSGKLLYFMRSLGYTKSMGVDVSKSALNLCKQFNLIEGKDVFLEDITKGRLKKEFDLVFSDGMLEHFENIDPFIKEMTKISRKYVLILQPNHFSLWNKIIRKTVGEAVKEYTYSVEDFKNAFGKYGFKLSLQKTYNLNEQFALLFEKTKS